jgi:type II secretory pathway pseudopilin PulG
LKINRKIRGRHGPGSQAGYLLLTIMLMVVLFTLAALAAAPELTQQIKRDRETELIHRGVQYARAVKRYFKKFGTYPTSIEALENTNNMRFLRRRYKDPITGKDFKLLHFGEVQVFATNAVGTPVSQMGGQSGFPSGMAGAAAMQNSGLSPAALAQQGGLGQGVAGGVQMGSSDNSQPGTAVTQPSGIQNNNSGNPNQQVFGGGAIVGVASTSDKIGIHEFNKKKKYSEWQFVYDPNLDRGGLIVGPAQPAVGGVGGVVQGQAGQQGQSGSNPSNPFSNSPFGNQPQGMQGPGMQSPGMQRPGGIQPQSNFPPDTPPQ